MSRHRPTEGEGGYPYNNSEYGDEGQQQYPSQSYPQQGYPQQPYPQQGHLQQQYYPQHQQYPQQQPKQPSPQQYPHQQSSASPFQQSLPPRQPSPSKQLSPAIYPYEDLSNKNSFLDDNRSNESYSDEEGTGKSHVHKDGWFF